MKKVKAPCKQKPSLNSSPKLKLQSVAGSRSRSSSFFEQSPKPAHAQVRGSPQQPRKKKKEANHKRSGSESSIFKSSWDYTPLTRSTQTQPVVPENITSTPSFVQKAQTDTKPLRSESKGCAYPVVEPARKKTEFKSTERNALALDSLKSILEELTGYNKPQGCPSVLSN